MSRRSVGTGVRKWGRAQSLTRFDAPNNNGREIPPVVPAAARAQVVVGFFGLRPGRRAAMEVCRAARPSALPNIFINW